MKGYTTLHINMPDADAELFARMQKKTGSRSYAETMRHALRALEEKEARRLKELGE